MGILELGSWQLTLFAMMLIGALLKKKDIIDENGMVTVEITDLDTAYTVTRPLGRR